MPLPSAWALISMPSAGWKVTRASLPRPRGGSSSPPVSRHSQAVESSGPVFASAASVICASSWATTSRRRATSRPLWRALARRASMTRRDQTGRPPSRSYSSSVGSRWDMSVPSDGAGPGRSVGAHGGSGVDEIAETHRLPGVVPPPLHGDGLGGHVDVDDSIRPVADPAVDAVAGAAPGVFADHLGEDDAGQVRHVVPAFLA